MNKAADAFALRLRIRNPFQDTEEISGGIHNHQVLPEDRAENGFHSLGLTLAQQAGIHEYRGELISDRFPHQGGGDGGIHSAGKR